MSRGQFPDKANRAAGGGLGVLKWGGNALDDPLALARAASEIGGAAPAVVVVSASRASTDLLLGAAQLALDGQVRDARRMAHQFGNHVRLRIRQLIPSPEAARLGALVDEEVKRSLAVCEGVRALRELSERTVSTLRASAQRAVAEFLAALAREHRGRPDGGAPTEELFADPEH